jgi:hypothetical protein
VPAPPPRPGPAGDGDASLTEAEVALVLRRASELNAAEGLGPGGGDDLVSLATVEAAAGEVGLEPADVRRAVAELRAGLLDAGSTARPVGGPVVTATRIVPGTPAAAGDAVRRYLSRQTFVVVRDQGSVQRWRRRDDTVATVLRAVQLRGTVRLDAAREVTVQIVPAEGGSLVRLDADLGRRVLVAPPATGGAVGAASAAGSTAAAVAVDPLVLAVGVPVTFALGYGSFWVSRAFVRRDQLRVRDALDGFLDDLERGGGAPRSVVDDVRDRIRGRLDGRRPSPPF